LTESNAILKYLADSKPSIPETVYPKEAKKRAEVDQLLEWYQCHFRPAIVAPLRTILFSQMKGETPDADVLKFLLEQTKPILDLLETLLGKHHGGFLTGEHVTLADL